jgi:hypothetical protein
VKKNIFIPFSEWFLYFEDLQLNDELILKDLKKLQYEFCDDDINIQNITKLFMSKNTNILSILTDGDSIKEKFKNLIKDSLKDMGINQDFEIQNSWSTLVKSNGFSEIHYHANYWLSAVYYPSGTLEDNIKIEFSRPQILPWDVTNNPIDSFFFNNKCKQIVKKGDLIVFPSYLKHRIFYYFGNLDRYSVAMNIAPIGKIGRNDSMVRL